MAAQLLLYPIDALRTLAQSRSGAAVGTGALLEQLGGARSLLSGCATTSSFALLVGGIQFAIVGSIRQHFPAVGVLGAAVCGGVGSCLVSVPQEVLKQRLIMGTYPNFAHAVRTIASAEGVRGFYAGWMPTCTRNVPFVVTTFTAYAALQRHAHARRWYGDRDGDGRLDPLRQARTNLVLGVCAALCGGVVTQPIDVVKTRLMTQASFSAAAPYKGVRDCVLTMLQEEGPGSLFRGLPQRSCYLGPLWAIQFAANEWVSARMLVANEKRREEAELGA